jgi:hypothetical protein
VFALLQENSGLTLSKLKFTSGDHPAGADAHPTACAMAPGEDFSR